MNLALMEQRAIIRGALRELERIIELDSKKEIYLQKGSFDYIIKRIKILKNAMVNTK
jgi:hypothetical protein